MLPYDTNRSCNNHCCRVTKPYLAGLLTEAREMLESPPMFDNEVQITAYYTLLKKIDKALENEDVLYVVPVAA